MALNKDTVSSSLIPVNADGDKTDFMVPGRNEIHSELKIEHGFEDLQRDLVNVLEAIHKELQIIRSHMMAITERDFDADTIDEGA